jgi:hypothetical protein
MGNSKDKRFTELLRHEQAPNRLHSQRFLKLLLTRTLESLHLTNKINGNTEYEQGIAENTRI